jgi:hypothetical protein
MTTIDRAQFYGAMERPDWLSMFNRVGEMFGVDGLVPLDPESLIAEARRNTKLEDFGQGQWREHLEVLCRAIEAEANLNFFGRVFTRAELVTDLEARLSVIDQYKRHPEIEKERIVEPVFIIGLGRSGTTILLEALGQDEQFRSVKRWESLYPDPLPDASPETLEQRIGRADQWSQLHDLCVPDYRAKHAEGGNLPVECPQFMHGSLFTEVYGVEMTIPSYSAYVARGDIRESYAWHETMLKLYQWQRGAERWLLKSPMHLAHIPILLEIYPDAKIVFPTRDPIVATASVVSTGHSLRGLRTDDPFAKGMGRSELGNVSWVANSLNRIVDFVEEGLFAEGSFAAVSFTGLNDEPLPTLRKLYRDIGLELSGVTEERITRFLKDKPKGVFGKHEYELGDRGGIAEERKLLERYQAFFDVPSEV